MKRLLSVFALSAVLFVAGCDDDKKQEVVAVKISYDFSTPQKFEESVAFQGLKEINPKSTATPKKGSFSAAQTKDVVFRYASAIKEENQSDYKRAINGLSGEAHTNASLKFLEQYIQGKSIVEMQTYLDK